MRGRTAGFTLLELLVAISVFSVISLGAYQMLQTVINANARVRATSDGFTSLNLAFSIMQRDFNQFVPREIRDGYGDPLPPMMFESEAMVIEFTRAGWNNPVGRLRSNLQRVAYSVDYESGELVRHFWTVLDRAEDSEPVSQVLLEDVEEFRVTGFSGEDDDEGFSLDANNPAAPLAVEVVIATGNKIELVRLFQLVEPHVRQGGAGGNDAGLPGEQVPDELTGPGS